MRQKFAKIDFAARYDDIPVKYNLLRQNSGNLMDWYIKKYNPFTVTSADVAGESGYIVKLPITASDAKNNYEKTVLVWENTIRALKDFDVAVILPPKNLPFEPKGVKLADDMMMLPLLLKKALGKLLAYAFETLTGKEVALLGSHSVQLMLSISSICPETNYLCLYTDEPDMDMYDELSKDIFDKTGLEIIVTKNERLVKTADIVINMFKNAKNASKLIKRGGIFIDLSRDEKGLAEAARSRPDVLFIDSFDIKYKGCHMTLSDFEMAVYLKSPSYRRLLSDGYDHDLAVDVSAYIDRQDLFVERFYRLSQPVPPSAIKRVLAKR